MQKLFFFLAQLRDSQAFLFWAFVEKCGIGATSYFKHMPTCKILFNELHLMGKKTGERCHLSDAAIVTKGNPPPVMRNLPT